MWESCLLSRGTCSKPVGRWKCFTFYCALPLYWGDSRRSWNPITAWAWCIWYHLHQAKQNLYLKRNKTYSQCWCQSRCGYVWLWYAWGTAKLTACLPVSQSRSIGVWECPTTWLFSPTWWSTTTRISQPVRWRCVHFIFMGTYFTLWSLVIQYIMTPNLHISCYDWCKRYSFSPINDKSLSCCWHK